MEAGQTVGGARPLRIGEVLDAAIKLYRRKATDLWKIVALIIIPVRIIDQLVLYASFPSDVYAHDGSYYSSTGGTGSALPFIVLFALGLIAASLTVGALSKCLIDAYLGRPSDWRRSLAFARERLASLLWLSIIAGVLLFVAYLLLIIPGIWLTVAWSVAVPVLMFEGKGGFGALTRSMELVRGRWWATFGAYVVAIILIIAVGVVVGIVFAAIESGLHVNSVGLTLVLDGLGNIIGDIIAYPFLAAVAAVIYMDLRVRKEGIDPECSPRASQAAAHLPTHRLRPNRPGSPPDEPAVARRRTPSDPAVHRRARGVPSGGSPLRSARAVSPRG
jgi:hypothetical protein